jgi:hypothetical protein
MQPGTWTDQGGVRATKKQKHVISGSSRGSDTACMASHAQATFNLPGVRSLQGGLKNTCSPGAKKNDFGKLLSLIIPQRGIVVIFLIS